MSVQGVPVNIRYTDAPPWVQVCGRTTSTTSTPTSAQTKNRIPPIIDQLEYYLYSYLCSDQEPNTAYYRST